VGFFKKAARQLKRTVRKIVPKQIRKPITRATRPLRGITREVLGGAAQLGAFTPFGLPVGGFAVAENPTASSRAIQGAQHIALGAIAGGAIGGIGAFGGTKMGLFDGGLFGGGAGGGLGVGKGGFWGALPSLIGLGVDIYDRFSDRPQRGSGPSEDLTITDATPGQYYEPPSAIAAMAQGLPPHCAYGRYRVRKNKMYTGETRCRRLNPLNPRALRRSITRVNGFARFVKSARRSLSKMATAVEGPRRGKARMSYAFGKKKSCG